MATSAVRTSALPHQFMFGSFLPSLWSLSNHSLLGSRSRHCYEIKWRLLGAMQIPRTGGVVRLLTLLLTTYDSQHTAIDRWASSPTYR
jgi:hypothetical protein